MKFNSPSCRILIFFIFALIFALMPLFPVFIVQQTSELTFSYSDFPFQQMTLAVFGLMLILFNKDLWKSESNPNLNLETNPESNYKKSAPLLKKIIWAVSCFIILTLISFVLQKLGSHLTHTKVSEIKKPDEIKTIIFCCLNFLFSAIYEESLYRFFLPESLLFFTRNCKDKKMAQIDCEIISCALFALGHIYLGLLSIVNAALAYVVLRLCFRKTKSLIPGTLSHFIYNLTQLMLF